jgi:hypothetical protein
VSGLSALSGISSRIGVQSKAVGAIVVIAIAGPAAAQAPPSPQSLAAIRVLAEQRYEIGVMERVFEGAVEHGITVTRDRLQAVAQMPADLLVSDNAHARGFRLEGYGVFFDVIVPSFNTTLWSFRTLDQNDLGLNSALKALETYIKEKGNPDVQQALRRVELQVNPGVLTRTAAAENAGARNASGSAASAPDANAINAIKAGPDAQAQPPASLSAGQAGQPPDSPADLKNGQAAAPPASDPILSDPSEAFRAEVIQALKDAMLAHSSSLGLAPTEWLTIAAKGNYDRPRLAPADSDAQTGIIRLRGSDLADFLANRITREEALGRIEVRVF